MKEVFQVFRRDPLSWVALLARWYVGVVFLAACIHKIIHPGAFAVDIATYDILPLVLINPLAIVLPWMELAVGLLLILGYRSRAAALITSGLMVMFLVAILLALFRGLNMSCGCFASQGAKDSDPISWLTVLRDLGWLSLSLFVLFFDHDAIGMDRMLSRRRKIRDVEN